MDLEKRLKKFDLPINRTGTMNKNNLLWLGKNFPVRNSDKKGFEEVYSEIQRRIDHKEYDN